MTPEEQALRDLWLAEMWKPVREWKQTKDEREDARRRNAVLRPQPVDSPGEKLLNCAIMGAAPKARERQGGRLTRTYPTSPEGHEPA